MNYLYWHALTFIAAFGHISDACAPYFRGADWLSKQRDFSTAMASTRCREQLRALADERAALRATGTGPGSQLCTDGRLFAGRWFCAVQCSRRCGGRASTMGAIRSVDCGQLRLRNGGRRADDVLLACTCVYDTGAMCSVPEHSWEDIEVSYILSGCQRQLISPATSSNGFNVDNNNNNNNNNNNIASSIDGNSIVSPNEPLGGDGQSTAGVDAVNELLRRINEVDPDLLQRVAQALSDASDGPR